LTIITNKKVKNLKKAILRRFSDESVVSSNAAAVVLKNGAALIFTRPDHLPCQPTTAAELLLDGCKIEPYTIVIMV
jgi:hypothetical protein